MTDKQDAPSAAFPLPGWEVLEASGTDAAAFLQAQTMNDLRPLQPGHWQWNGWLTPKGRLIALFALAALDPQRYWLVMPDVPAVELASGLQRFVFRSKVKLLARADLLVFGNFAAPAHARDAILHRESLETVEFDLGGDGGARTLRIAPAKDLSGESFVHSSQDAADDGNTGRWDAFDLAHGLPRLPSDQREAWTPQMLSLERLRAFSVKKGCYPGQEIVARTHFLGQAKRGLARIAGHAPGAGAEVSAQGRVLGTVVATAGSEALAVLAVDRPATGWSCAGSECRELSLLGSLAR